MHVSIARKHANDVMKVDHANGVSNSISPPHVKIQLENHVQQASKEALIEEEKK